MTEHKIEKEETSWLKWNKDTNAICEHYFLGRIVSAKIDWMIKSSMTVGSRNDAGLHSNYILSCESFSPLNSHCLAPLCVGFGILITDKNIWEYIKLTALSLSSTERL